MVDKEFLDSPEERFRANEKEITDPLLKMISDKFGISLKIWGTKSGTWKFSSLFWNNEGGLVLSVLKNKDGTTDETLAPLEVLSYKDDNEFEDLKYVQERIKILMTGKYGFCALTDANRTNYIRIPDFKTLPELKMKLELDGN